MSKIYLSSKGFKPADGGAVRILNRQLELLKEKDTLVFPEGIYYLLDPILIYNKGVRLQAEGETILRAYHKGNGMVLTRSKGTYWTEIEGLIISSNDNDPPVTGRHGIECNVPLKMKDCEIHSFHGHGLYLWASVDGERPNTNVAFSKIESVLIQSCKGDGVYIQGGDSSQIHFTHMDVRDCEGIGFHDDSFFGCQFFSCMAHNNVKGNYRSLSPVNSSGWYGCYSERGINPDLFGGSAQVFGGTFSGDLLAFGSNAAGYINGNTMKKYNEHLFNKIIE